MKVAEIINELRLQDTIQSNDKEYYTSYSIPLEMYVTHIKPKWAVKANLLYGLATLTPNVALEMGLSRQTTLELSASYNPWNLKGSLEDNKKLAHFIIRPEFRYWLCERFNGHFLGTHVFYGAYNIGTQDIPTLFEKEYRYEGFTLGAGLTYGYNLMLSKHWGVEFHVGIGAAWLKYDRYPCNACSRNSEKDMSKTYIGPTRAGISFIYHIQ